MKKTILSILFITSLVITSCKEEDDSLSSCKTCNSSQTPSFEVCENNAGNATVNGEDTGTPFDTYIEGLEAAGASCGG